MDAITSLLQAVRFFQDKDNCRKFMIQIRWADGVVKCPNCGSDKVAYLAKQDRYKCYGKHPKSQFSLKVGTIFEDSPIGMDKWLPAAWLVINCKNGISSYEIARDLEVTQKTAWFMLHRVRLAMQTGTFNSPMTGQVEVDETFIGGKARNMHAAKRKERIHGRGPTGKAVVLGMMERGGRVRTKVVAKRNKKTLQAEVKANVAPGSEVFTDELLSYWGLEKDFIHQIINHAEEYVRGNVHTNGMENFWSLLKRGLNGTYISVEPFHLFRYLDEQMFRFNLRELNDGERFITALQQIVGKRLTYAELTGRTEAVQP